MSVLKSGPEDSPGPLQLSLGMNMAPETPRLQLYEQLWLRGTQLSCPPRNGPTAPLGYNAYCVKPLSYLVICQTATDCKYTFSILTKHSQGNMPYVKKKKLQIQFLSIYPRGEKSVLRPSKDGGSCQLDSLQLSNWKHLQYLSTAEWIDQWQYFTIE